MAPLAVAPTPGVTIATDYPDLPAAVEALPYPGGIVYLPLATYKLKEPLDLADIYNSGQKTRWLTLQSSGKPNTTITGDFPGQPLVDATFHWQRLVRYHRPGLKRALRWDARQDRIVFRALNGRTLPEPQFQCTGVDNRRLPWLTGDVSRHDNFSWVPVLDNRPQHKHVHQPLPIRIEHATKEEKA